MRSGIFYILSPVSIYPSNSIIVRTVNNDGNTDVEGGNTPVANDAESVKAIVICSGPENDNIDIHLKKVFFKSLYSFMNP